jgi:hypothetical protein
MEHSSCSIISVTLKRETSTEYEPCWPGKDYSLNLSLNPIQDYTLHNFFRLFVFCVGHPAKA